MSIAQSIAGVFFNDNETFEESDGHHIETFCRSMNPVYTEVRPTDKMEQILFVFHDRSWIVINSHRWFTNKGSFSLEELPFYYFEDFESEAG